MKVRYMGKSDPLTLTHGKVYEIIEKSGKNRPLL